MQLEQTLIPYTKISSECLKNINLRHDTIELIEENISRTFSDVNCSSVFLGQSPKAIEIKAKINKWYLIKLISFCTGNQLVQLLSCVQLFVTPWTAARQVSPPITNSRSWLKLMIIESVMPSSHLILCHPLPQTKQKENLKTGTKYLQMMQSTRA